MEVGQEGDYVPIVTEWRAPADITICVLVWLPFCRCSCRFGSFVFLPSTPVDRAMGRMPVMAGAIGGNMAQRFTP